MIEVLLAVFQREIAAVKWWWPIYFVGFTNLLTSNQYFECSVEYNITNLYDVFNELHSIQNSGSGTEYN